MAESETEVLTRDKALPQNILPTGRKVGAVTVRGTSLYEIKYVDGKQGMIPEPYQGRYTGLQQANKAIKEFVAMLWDISDNATKQKSKPLSNAVSR